MNQKIVVLSRSKAQAFSSDVAWACISISDDPSDKAKINKCQQRGILRLSFADAEEGDYVLFTHEMANQIIDFVETLWSEIDILVIHCYAGACRSPAVAAALARRYYGENSKYFELFTPNQLVYRTMCEAIFERDS